MEEIIRNLGKIHAVLPNAEFGGKISDLDEYKFINAVLIPVKDPLWEQAVKNIAAEIYDGDLFVVHDSDLIYNTILDRYIEDVAQIANYYTGIIDKTYKLITIEHDYYYVNNYNKISVETLCKITSECFVNHLQMLEDNIKKQLLIYAHNIKNAEDQFKDNNKALNDIDVKQIITRIKKILS